jgi:DNA-binding Xre family transcriptional regulator
MTIEELANATGLTVTTVNKIELAYKSPRIESLLLLCNALSCEPNDLLPKVRGRSSTKNELLDELHAVASQMTPKKIRELLAFARGEE